MGQPKDLYILPFDHRGSFIKMFGFDEKNLTPEQAEKLRYYKRVIFYGFTGAIAAGAPAEKAAILVDEQFGSDVQMMARELGVTRILPVEKSGQDEFDFEYGDEFVQHIEDFRPDYVKVLVRYNPQEDRELNNRQVAKLKQLNGYCKASGRKFLFELLVPPTKGQLEQCGGSKEEFEKTQQGSLMRLAIGELHVGGIDPDVWKLEGLDDPEDMRWVVYETFMSRNNAGVVVLGRGESEEKVTKWLSVAAKIDGVIGFAVGRTVFSGPLKQYHEGKIDRRAATDAIAQNYLKFVNLFENARKQ